MSGCQVFCFYYLEYERQNKLLGFAEISLLDRISPSQVKTEIGRQGLFQNLLFCRYVITETMLKKQEMCCLLGANCRKGELLSGTIYLQTTSVSDYLCNGQL